MFRPGDNPKNNCVVYSDYYYINPYGQYKVLDVLQCPEEAKYLIKEKKYCLDDCLKDFEYKYLYNGNCLKNCPEGTININYKCIENMEECKLIESDIHLKEKEDFKLIKTLAKTYLNEFNYTNNHISLYTDNDYSMVFYKNRNCTDKIPLTIPKIDFQECYDKVKKEYNITEDLLISIISQNGVRGTSNSFKFFHPLSGEELNVLKICQNEKIIIKKDVATELINENNSNFNLQMSLIEQGVDIFNLDSPFYKDLCFDYDNKEKRDIPLNMRIEKAFPNVELCEKGCKAKGIQLPEKVAVCDCSLNDIVNNNIIKDNALLDTAFGKAFDIINSSNIMVMKCYKYIFKYFKRSIGGFISIALIFSHIISIILYFKFGYPKLKTYILDLTERYLSFLYKIKINIESSPPPKKPILKNVIQESKNINPSRKGKIKISNNPKFNRVHSKHVNTKNNIADKNKEIDKKLTRKLLLANSKFKLKNSNNIIISPKESPENKSKLQLLDDSKKKNEKVPACLQQTKENEEKKFFEEYLAVNPDDMELDDALVYDKRTFSECLVENLKEKQMIAFTFFSSDPIKIRVMKIILLILNVNLYFVITGLFYDEEYIAELYKIKDEDENFFSYIPRSAVKLIYTTLVSIIIGYIVELFFVEEKKIKKLFKREKENSSLLKEEIINLTKHIHKTNLAFIIFVMIILLFSFYYFLCFNYVYPKTQIEWIKCSITIMIIMQILSALKCLLQTSLRYLSFKFNSAKIYKISRLLD